MSNSFVNTYRNELIACVANAVVEDLGGQGDHTSKAVFPKDHKSKAQLIAKGDGHHSGPAGGTGARSIAASTVSWLGWWAPWWRHGHVLHLPYTGV